MPWRRRRRPNFGPNGQSLDTRTSTGGPSPGPGGLNPVLAEDLELKRSWVSGFVPSEHRGAFDASWESKIDWLARILEQVEIATDDAVALQALGVVLGDAIAQRLDGSWVQVEDEYGTDAAVLLGGTTDAIVFPQTMISKRVERGEILDRDSLAGLIEFSAEAKRRT